jgi:hypothetical protein
VVVDSRHQLIGVIPESSPKDVTTLREVVQSALEPRTLVDRIVAQRIIPSAFPPSVSIFEPGQEVAGQAPIARVVCNFEARCEQQVVIGNAMVVEVTASQQPLAATLEGQSMRAAGLIEPSTDLVVELVPRSPLLQLSSSRIVISSPAEHDQWKGYFFLQPTQVGPADIWVLVSQSQSVIVLLQLEPMVVASRAKVRR